MRIKRHLIAWWDAFSQEIRMPTDLTLMAAALLAVAVSLALAESGHVHASTH